MWYISLRCDESGDELGKVVFALAKRRELDRDHLQTVVQVVAEIPFLEGLDNYERGQLADALSSNEWQPGEYITFEIDNDPTTIKGGSSVQSGEAGPISGLELSGSTMTAEFADEIRELARMTERDLDHWL